MISSFNCLRFFVVAGALFPLAALAADGKRPNILVAMSDDQSWAHASAYGYKAVATPVFDRVAQMGVLFNHAFAGSPGCSPSRAALLTGRHTWMIEDDARVTGEGDIWESYIRYSPMRKFPSP